MVIPDVKSYEEIQEALALLKILTLGNRQIEEGKARPAGEVLAEAATSKDYLIVQSEGKRRVRRREKLDAFLQLNERDILTDAGRVTKEVADRLALEQYEQFHERRLLFEARRDEEAFDEAVAKLTAGDAKRKGK